MYNGPAVAAVQDLVQHLKANPTDRNVDAIAAQFGVDSRIVQIAIDSMPRTPKAHSAAREKAPSILLKLPGIWKKLTSNLLAFFLCTDALYFFGLPVMDHLSSQVDSVSKLWKSALMMLTFLFIPAVQIVALSTNPKFRNVLIGALSFGISLAGGLYLIAFTSTHSTLKVSGEAITPGSLLIMTALGFALFYVFLGTPVAVGAAYVRMRREQKSNERMSRQQMLERLMIVRAALDQAASTPTEESQRQQLLKRVDRNAVWIALTAAVLLTAGYSASMRAADPNGTLMSLRTSSKMPEGLNPALLIVPMILNFLTLVTQFGLGLTATRIRRALLIGLVYVAGYIGIHLTPIAYMSMSKITAMGWLPFLIGTWSQLVLVCLGCLARQVYDHSRTSARRSRNDPDALFAEMLDLEWRLTPQSSEVTVLAVDVCGSTAMKRESDPIVTEWSFREYQVWVAKTCAAYGGKVESTAGDGAILGFESPQAALDAAVALQSRIEEFNTTVNKMSELFKLRIGLHSGQVKGSLGDVQFTRVIDVAAHIEAKAPIGGIAASETVVTALPGKNFQKTNAGTDGHDVFVFVP